MVKPLVCRSYNYTCSSTTEPTVLSRVLVIKTGFGLIIGFINRLQVLTTINYNTVTNFHSYK
jgi:hypothetical protein